MNAWCPQCGGNGGEAKNGKWVKCQTCKGTGKVPGWQCPKCKDRIPASIPACPKCFPEAVQDG